MRHLKKDSGEDCLIELPKEKNVQAVHSLESKEKEKNLFLSEPFKNPQNYRVILLSLCLDGRAIC